MERETHLRTRLHSQGCHAKAQAEEGSCGRIFEQLLLLIHVFQEKEAGDKALQEEP